MLLGENGAGKSSLMKVLCGAYIADAGTLHCNGSQVRIRGPADAKALGIAVIFLRNQMRPIIRLADAADRLGKGRPVGNLRIGGASEIRQAARAFS